MRDRGQTVTAEASSGPLVKSRAPRALRSRLMLLVVSLVVPSLIAGAAALYNSYRNDRIETSRSLGETARALSLAIDRHLSQAEAMLWATVASPYLANRDFPALDVQVRRAIRQSDVWLVLADPQRQLIDTRVPPGAALPPQPAINWEALSSDHATVENLTVGPGAQEPSVAVSLIVEAGGGQRYLLSLVTAARSLSAILSDQRLPEGWIGAILDRNGRVIARTRDADNFVGRPATPDVIGRVRAGVASDVFDSVSLTGAETIAAISRSPVSGWTTVLAVPKGEIADAARLQALALLGLGLLLFALGFFLTFAIARSIARPVEDLARAASAIGEGRSADVAVTPYDFSETAAVREALGAASDALRQRALERDRAESDLRRLNETLEERVTARTAELAESNQMLLAEIEERRQTEARLAQAQRLEAVGQLTGGLAHDFNNLLTAIIGSLDLLTRRFTGNDDETVRRLLDIASSGAQRGARLTAQLLAFSRKQMLEPRPIDANDSVQSMSGLLRSTLGGTIRIETQLAAGLWPAMADSTQVELVILNLALNARDAMPAGGTLTIRTANVTLDRSDRAEAPQPGDHVLVAVTDNGTGIAPEVLPRVLEPFFTTKEVGRGSGLGLSQVLGIAKQLGGGVAIESRLGEGTTVSLFLPRATETARQARPAESGDADSGKLRLRGCRILLVDDDHDVRRAVSGMLTEAGATVIELDSGHAAVTAAHRAQGDFDLVLMDHAMPGLTGAMAARTIRQKAPDLPIVIMTGYAERVDIAPSGAIDGLIRKPFRVDELADKLAAIFAGPKSTATVLAFPRRS
jgi:signal transduction histidine kinase/ActR/RegA family two-component response regulator